ncbi:hypothetical protein AIIKEEIJ_02759 [Rhodococcus sp. YH1]|nr:hypothetical protein [Rhodococcus sp. YH1]
MPPRITSVIAKGGSCVPKSRPAPGSEVYPRRVDPTYRPSPDRSPKSLRNSDSASLSAWVSTSSSAPREAAFCNSSDMYPYVSAFAARYVMDRSDNAVSLE